MRMGTFSLGNLLRYALAGGLFMLSYATASVINNREHCLPDPPLLPDPLNNLLRGDVLADAGLILGTVLLFGSLIYVVHRAAVYPVLYRLVGWLWPPENRGRGWRYVCLEMDYTTSVTRWRALDQKHVVSHLREWNDQVHFLYCSTWALLLTVWLNYTSLIVWCFVILFIISLIHHTRALCWETRILQTVPVGCKPSSCSDDGIRN